MPPPAALGYHMPAEWHPHQATWLAWPHNPDTWPPPLLREVERTYAEMMHHLLKGEAVHVLVRDETMEAHARAVLVANEVDANRVGFHRLGTVDAWIRDYGPTFLRSDECRVSSDGKLAQDSSLGIRHSPLAMVGWRFNGWGGKYPEYERDSDIPARINERLQIPRFEPGLAFEGGSIDVNGCGTVLTTEQCLLNPNRNPHQSKADLEQIMRDYLGASHIVWLKEGIAGDDTDGHVDDIARFVNPTTVVCAVEQNGEDENYQPLLENYELLRNSTDQDGKPLNVITLPMPEPLFTDEPSPPTPLPMGEGLGVRARRLPASYANFYIDNAAVLVPIFDGASDAQALQILQQCFPDRRVVGIDCRALVFGYGSIHCVTQQQPRVA